MGDQAAPGGGPPPGWYPDPHQGGQLRWWDGSRWTEHTAPQQPPSSPTGPGGGQQPAGGGSWGGQQATGPGSWGTGSQSWGGPPAVPGPPWGGQPAGGGYPAKPVETWLWQSIAVTLLCCMPLGVVGIIFAAQAQGALNAGNVLEAQRKADTARSFTIAGFVVGLLFIPFVLLAGF